MTALLLALVLTVLAPGYGLIFADVQPYPGALGLACDRELFGAVEGNAQAMCPADKVVALYPEAMVDPVLAFNVLAHEARHITLGVVEGETAYERFREREAYQAGCTFAWVSMCKDWLR